MAHDDRYKQKLAARLNRVEGQIRAIKRMLEADEPCANTLMQIAAAKAALGKVGTILMQHHLETCVVDAIQGGSGRESIDEIIEVLDRFA